MKYQYLLCAKLSAIILGCFLFCNGVKAQYVTIPDTAFVSWLDSNGYAGCMNGNLMDTSCSAILNAGGLYCDAVPIRDLTGIQYFKSLYFLDCAADSLYYIPALPMALGVFNCQSNNMVSLPALPGTLTNLTCSYNQLTSLPGLPASLLTFSCNNNKLSSLRLLPASLEDLSCNNNQLTSLPELSASLQSLDCSYNRQLSCLPELHNLSYLNFDSTAITCIPNIIAVNQSIPPLDTVPLCDSVSSGCPSFTGILPLADKLAMQLYPNPAKNYVIVETDENALGGILQITDVMGRLVFQSAISNRQSAISTLAFAGSIYFVKGSDLNGRSGVGKLVVE